MVNTSEESKMLNARLLWETGVRCLFHVICPWAAEAALGETPYFFL